jgi:hypothetical protein
MLHKCRAGCWVGGVCWVRERAWCSYRRARVLCTQNVGVWRYFLKITAIHVVRAAALQHIAAEFIRNKGRARESARQNYCCDPQKHTAQKEPNRYHYNIYGGSWCEQQRHPRGGGL